MKSKLMLGFVLMIIMGSVLTACGQSEQNEGTAGLAIELLASEKIFPADFYEEAEQGVLAKKVTDQNEFEAEWDHFGLEGEPPLQEWDEQAVIFLSMIESGSCPYDLQAVQLNEDETELIVHLRVESESPCTDDATPRTFVFALNADEIKQVNWINIENFAGLNPRVPLHGENKEEDVSGLIKEGLPGTHPPNAYIEVGNERHEMKLGTYCWQAGNVGECVDTVGPVQLLEGSEPVPIKPGQTIRFVIEGDPQPNKIDLIQIHHNQQTSIKVENAQFTAPDEKGVYYYYLGVWWQDEKRPNVSLGDAFYAFVIEVK